MISTPSLLSSQEIIVSSQAVAGSVLHDPEALTRIAIDAIAGGATALRLASADTVRLASSRVSVPIIGLIKTERANFDPRITAISQEIHQLKEAGAGIVAIDATHRNRPEPLEDLFNTALSNELEIFADIATLDEAKASLDRGATYVATTMAGYTKDREATAGPDFELLEKVIALGGKTVLEGRVSNAQHIRQAFDLGAYAVVIGRAVTSPQTILKDILKSVEL